MKRNALAAVIALGFLVAACGGGGGSTSASTQNPSTGAPVTAGVASFAGVRGDYSIARTANGYTVAERRTGASSNVTGAKVIRFADMSVNLEIADKSAFLGRGRTNDLIELYMAFLARVPDANSLAVWMDRLNAGQSEIQVADALYAEALQNPGITGYAAGMTNSDFVTAVYKTAFGRFGATAPSAAVVESWSARIDKGGISRGALMIAMLDAAHSGQSDLNTPAVTLLLDNRTSVGYYFAVQHGISYNTADLSLSRTAAIAAAVTATDITAAQAVIGFSDSGFAGTGAGK